MLIYGRDREVAKWVAGQLGYPDSWPCSAAIGYYNEAKELKAGICFDNASDTNIYAHIAVDGKVPSSLLGAGAAYIFLQCKAKRVTFLVYDDNQPCINLVCDMGAQLEGRLKDGHGKGDVLIYVIWADSPFFTRLLAHGRVPEGIAK